MGFQTHLRADENLIYIYVPAKKNLHLQVQIISSEFSRSHLSLRVEGEKYRQLSSKQRNFEHFKNEEREP